MKCKTVDDVLKAMSVDDVFTNNPSILKAEYREYLKMFHPDFHNGEMTYQEVTSKIVMLMNKEKDKSNERQGFESEGLEQVLASLILEGWL